MRYVYYATLSNLTGSTAYFFRVADSAPPDGIDGVFSKEFNFVTAPESGALTENFTFVTGGGTAHSQTLQVGYLMLIFFAWQTWVSAL